MSSICKYCNKVELIFDNAFKSKSGKMIPLDKISGLPHQCSESPYNHQQTRQQTQSKEPTTTELLHELLYKLKIIQAQIKELKALGLYSP